MRTKNLKELGTEMNPQVRRIKRSGEKECSFCRKSEVNDEEWGEMYELEDIVVHYFCMLFSSGLIQEGEDDEGILGFLPNDLRKEIRRGEKLKCKFCKGKGASIGCIIKACKTSFHFTCGLPEGTLHRFSKNFGSYCLVHRPELNIPKDKFGSDCLLCCSVVTSDEPAVWPPCCKKYIFHRSCMQKHASAAGLHHFSCPNCREQEKFLTAMQNCGVFVPDRDAQWEEDGNYADLEELYANCDARHCLCPHGRKYDGSKVKNNDKRWEIVRCNVCAAKAVHFLCGKLKFLKWKCSDCIAVITRVETSVKVTTDNDILIEESCVSCDESVSTEAEDCNTNLLSSDLKKLRGPFDFISKNPHVVVEIQKIGTLTNNRSIIQSAVSEWTSKLRRSWENSNSSNSSVGSKQLKKRTPVVDQDQSKAEVFSSGNSGSSPYKQLLKNLKGSSKTHVLDEISCHSTNLSSESVNLNMKRALKSFLVEKNADSSERDTKSFAMGVKLPSFVKTSSDVETSEGFGFKVDKVTATSLSSIAKALADASKKPAAAAPAPGSLFDFDSKSKGTTLSKELRHRIATKFANELQILHASGDQSEETGFPTVEISDDDEIVEIPVVPLSRALTTFSYSSSRSIRKLSGHNLKSSGASAGHSLRSISESSFGGDNEIEVLTPSFGKPPSFDSCSLPEEVILSSCDEEDIIVTSPGKEPSSKQPKVAQVNTDVDLLDIPTPTPVPVPASSSTCLPSKHLVPHDIWHNRRAHRNHNMNSNRSDNYLTHQLNNPIYFTF